MKSREENIALCPITFCERLEIAESPLRRFRGLMFGAQRGDILVFPQCNDVHTFGMRRSIDVAFLDEFGMVMETHRDVPGGRRLRCGGASTVLERYADPWSRWLERDDIVHL